MMKLQNAYETISDLERRRAYDLRWTSKNIAAEKARAEVEERVRIAKAQEEARRRAEKEARDKAARYEKECAERKAKAAREAWEAQEARDAAEAIRSWHVLKAYREQLQREKEDRERREKDTTKCHTGIPRPNAGTAGSACQHKSFWAKLEGSRICSHCQMFQRRFAFKCPDCSKVACASCRQVLRDEKGRRGTHGPQRGYVHDSNE